MMVAKSSQNNVLNRLQASAINEKYHHILKMPGFLTYSHEQNAVIGIFNDLNVHEIINFARENSYKIDFFQPTHSTSFFVRLTGIEKPLLDKFKKEQNKYVQEILLLSGTFGKKGWKNLEEFNIGARKEAADNIKLQNSIAQTKKAKKIDSDKLDPDFAQRRENYHIIHHDVIEKVVAVINYLNSRKTETSKFDWLGTASEKNYLDDKQSWQEIVRHFQALFLNRITLSDLSKFINEEANKFEKSRFFRRNPYSDHLRSLAEVIEKRNPLSNSDFEDRRVVTNAFKTAINDPEVTRIQYGSPRN